MSLTLFIGNDNVLTVVGLQNSVDDSYLNSSTVTVTLVDSDGTELTGETWPVSVAYVAASNGNYQATLADTITGLSADDAITAKITSDAGPGLKGYWEIPVIATTRVT